MAQFVRKVKNDLSAEESQAIPSWNPIRLREYLEEREGKIWTREDSLLLLRRAEEIDALIENLMRAAGINVESEE
jgi:hypothetical protein